MISEKLKAFEAIDLKFQSGNDVPVTQARVSADEWQALKAAWNNRAPAQDSGELPNVTQTAPKSIFLVIGEGCPPEADFTDCDEVTWCKDKIDLNSIEYVRADQMHAYRQEGIAQERDKWVSENISRLHESTQRSIENLSNPDPSDVNPILLAKAEGYLAGRKQERALWELTANGQALEKAAGDWREPTTHAQRVADAVQLLCAGKRPPDEIVEAWFDDDERLQNFAAENGPSWAQGIAVIDAARVLAEQPTEGVEHEFRDAQPSAPAVPQRWIDFVEEAVGYVGCESHSPSLEREAHRLLCLAAAPQPPTSNSVEFDGIKTPRPQVELTDAEIDDALSGVSAETDEPEMAYEREVARAAIAADRAKNGRA